MNIIMSHISYSIIILITAISSIVVPQDNGLESMMLQDHPVIKAELKLASEEDEESYVQLYDEGKYKDRKFKAVNSHLKTILSIAFQIPEEQMVEESLLPLDHYTMKVVVPEGKESLLRSTIEENIEAKIGINIRHELRNTRAAVLSSLEK